MADRSPYFMQALSLLIINKQKFCSDVFHSLQYHFRPIRVKEIHLKIFYSDESYIAYLNFSTEFVFFGPIRKTSWPPRPLIC